MAPPSRPSPRQVPRASKEIPADDEDDEDAPVVNRRQSLKDMVARNKAAIKKIAEEQEAAAAEEARQQDILSTTLTPRRGAWLLSDATYAQTRANSEVRKALARREQKKEKASEFFAAMDKVRCQQSAAIAGAHGQTEKVQSRLRITRRSKELLDLQADRDRDRALNVIARMKGAACEGGAQEPACIVAP